VLSVVVGQPAENTKHRGLVMFSSCSVIGSVFCHSWGHYVTAKSKGRARKCDFDLTLLNVYLTLLSVDVTLLNEHHSLFITDIHQSSLFSGQMNE
jgi:hypothetical protein